MKLWVGTSGFQYPEWKGGFYPATLSVAKMLAFYAARFPTTEINYSFRQIPSPKTLQRWSDGTPERFKFSLKAPQKVTHFARLKDCGETIRYFHETISALGEKLGPVLFQLPPNFVKDAPRLSAFLDDLPKGIQAAFEFRHASWFEEEIFALLRGKNAALCIAESETLVAPDVATADFGYLRLRREDYTATDLVRWSETVQTRRKQWREVFVYFKHEETGVGPKFAQTFLEADAAAAKPPRVR